MKWPTDKFLQYLITWFVTGWCWQVLFSQPPQTTTTGEAVQQWLGLFFVNLVSPMMFGAICSEFPLVSLRLRRSIHRNSDGGIHSVRLRR